MVRRGQPHQRARRNILEICQNWQRVRKRFAAAFAAANKAEQCGEQELAEQERASPRPSPRRTPSISCGEHFSRIAIFSRDFSKVFAAGFAAANPEANPSYQNLRTRPSHLGNNLFKVPTRNFAISATILGRKLTPQLQKPSSFSSILHFHHHLSSSMASNLHFMGDSLTLAMSG